MQALWFEDLAVGQTYQSSEHLVTEEEIVEFAQKWDPQPFHLSHDGAAGTIFETLAASGWHTAAITMRLLLDALPLAAGSVGLGVELKWLSPTRPGDQLQVVLKVTGVRKSATKPGWGIVEFSYDTVNQNAQVRQRSTSRALVQFCPRRGE